jgi:hypothetical protein
LRGGLHLISPLVIDGAEETYFFFFCLRKIYLIIYHDILRFTSLPSTDVPAGF